MRQRERKREREEHGIRDSENKERWGEKEKKGEGRGRIIKRWDARLIKKVVKLGWGRVIKVNKSIGDKRRGYIQYLIFTISIYLRYRFSIFTCINFPFVPFIPSDPTIPTSVTFHFSEFLFPRGMALPTRPHLSGAIVVWLHITPPLLALLKYWSCMVHIHILFNIPSLWKPIVLVLLGPADGPYHASSNSPSDLISPSILP